MLGLFFWWIGTPIRERQEDVVMNVVQHQLDVVLQRPPEQSAGDSHLRYYNVVAFLQVTLLHL